MKISQQRIRYLAKRISAIDPNHKIKIKLEKVESIDESTYEQFSRSTFSGNIDFPNLHIPEESHVAPAESGIATPPIFICKPDGSKLKTPKPELMKKAVSPLESDRSPSRGGESIENASCVPDEHEDQHARSFFEKVSAELIQLESGAKDKKMKKRKEKADRESDEKSKEDKPDITEEWNILIAPKPAKNSRSSSTSDLGGVTTSTESTPKLRSKYRELGSKASSLFDLWIFKGSERSSSADSTPKPKLKRDGKSPCFRDLTDSSIESSPKVPNRKKDKKMATTATVAEPEKTLAFSVNPNESSQNRSDDLEKTLEQVMIITRNRNDTKVVQEERTTKITDGDDNSAINLGIFCDDTDSQPPVAPPRKKKLQKQKLPEFGAINQTTGAEKVLSVTESFNPVNLELNTTCTNMDAVSKGSNKNVQNQMENVNSQQIQEISTNEKDPELQILEKYPGTSTKQALVSEQLSRGKSSRKSKKKIKNQSEVAMTYDDLSIENIENSIPSTPAVNEDLLESQRVVSSQMTTADDEKEINSQVEETSSDLPEGDPKPTIEEVSTEKAIITEQLSRGKSSRKSKKKSNNQLEATKASRDPITENLENLSQSTPAKIEDLLESQQDAPSEMTIAGGEKETDSQQVKDTSSNLNERNSKQKVLESGTSERAFIPEQLSRGKSSRKSKKNVNTPSQLESVITSSEPSTENLRSLTQFIPEKNKDLELQQGVPSQITIADREKETNFQQVKETSSNLHEGDSKQKDLENEPSERAFVPEQLSRGKSSRKSKKKSNNHSEATIAPRDPLTENLKNSTQSTPAKNEDLSKSQQDAPSEMTIADGEKETDFQQVEKTSSDLPDRDLKPKAQENDAIASTEKALIYEPLSTRKSKRKTNKLETSDSPRNSTQSTPDLLESLQNVSPDGGKDTGSQQVPKTSSDLPDRDNFTLQILENAPEISTKKQTVVSEEKSSGKSKKKTSNQSEGVIIFSDPPTENLNTSANEDSKLKSSSAAEEKETAQSIAEDESSILQSDAKVTDDFSPTQTSELKRNKSSRKSKKGKQNADKDTSLPEISNVKKSSDAALPLKIDQELKNLEKDDLKIPLEEEAKLSDQSSKGIPSEKSKPELIKLPAQKLSDRDKPTEKGSAIKKSESVVPEGLKEQNCVEGLPSEPNLAICSSTDELLKTNSLKEVNLTDHNEPPSLATEGSTTLTADTLTKKASRKSKKKNANRSTSEDLTKIENKTPKVILEPTPNLSAPALLLKKSSQVEEPEYLEVLVPKEDAGPAEEFPQNSAASFSLLMLQNMTDHINEVKNMIISKKMKQDESSTPSSDFHLEKEVTELCQQLKYQDQSDKAKAALIPGEINLFNTEFKYRNKKIESEDEKRIPNASSIAMFTENRNSFLTEAINENQTTNKKNKKKSKRNIAQENESCSREREEPETFEPFVDCESNLSCGTVPKEMNISANTLENENICSVKVDVGDNSIKNEKSSSPVEAENAIKKSRKSRQTLKDSRTEIEITESEKEAPKPRDPQTEKNCQYNSSEQDVPTKIDQEFPIHETGETAGGAIEIKNESMNPKPKKNQRSITEEITTAIQLDNKKALEVDACKTACPASLFENEIAKDEDDLKLQVLSSNVARESHDHFKQHGFQGQSTKQTAPSQTKKNKKPNRNQNVLEKNHKDEDLKIFHDETLPEKLVPDYKITEEALSCELSLVSRCEPEEYKNINSKKTKRNQLDKELKLEEDTTDQGLAKDLKISEETPNLDLTPISRSKSNENKNQTLGVRNRNSKKSKDQELESSPGKISTKQEDIERVPSSDLPPSSRNESKKDQNQAVDKREDLKKLKGKQKDQESRISSDKIPQPEEAEVEHQISEEVPGSDLPSVSRKEYKEDQNQAVAKDEDSRKSNRKQKDQELRISSEKMLEPVEVKVKCEISEEVPGADFSSVFRKVSNKNENQSVDMNRNSKEKQKDQKLKPSPGKIQSERITIEQKNIEQVPGSDLPPPSRNNLRKDQNQEVDESINLKKSKGKQKNKELRISSDKIPQHDETGLEYQISEEVPGSDDDFSSDSKSKSKGDGNQTLDTNKNTKKSKGKQKDQELRISSDKIPQTDEAEVEHQVSEGVPGSDDFQSVCKNKNLKKSKGEQKDQELKSSCDKIPQPEEAEVKHQISEEVPVSDDFLSDSRSKSKKDENQLVEENENLKKSKRKQKHQELKSSLGKIPPPEEAEVKHEISEEVPGPDEFPSVSRKEPKEDENKTVDQNKSMKKSKGKQKDQELRILLDKIPQPEEAEVEHQVTEKFCGPDDFASVSRKKSKEDENQTVNRKNLAKLKGKQRDQELRISPDKVPQAEEAEVEDQISEEVSGSNPPSVPKTECKEDKSKTIDNNGDFKKSKGNQKEKEPRKSCNKIISKGQIKESKIIENTPDSDLTFISRDESQENKNQSVSNKYSKKSKKNQTIPRQVNCENQKSESYPPILETQSNVNDEKDNNENGEADSVKQAGPINSGNHDNNSSPQIEGRPDLEQNTCIKECIVENVEKRDDVSNETQTISNKVQTKGENETGKYSTSSSQKELLVPQNVGLDIDSESRQCKSNDNEACTAKKNRKTKKSSPYLDEFTKESKENNVKEISDKVHKNQIENSENMTAGHFENENMTEMASHILKEVECVPKEMNIINSTKTKSRKSKKGKPSLLHDEVSNLPTNELSEEKLDDQIVTMYENVPAEERSTCSPSKEDILEIDDILSKQLENTEIEKPETHLKVDLDVDKNEEVQNRTKRTKKSNEQNVPTQSKGFEDNVHLPVEMILALGDGASTINEDLVKQDKVHQSQQKSGSKIQINQATTSKLIETKTSFKSRKNKKTKRVHFDENVLQLTEPVEANDMEQNSEVVNKIDGQLVNPENEIFKSDEYDELFVDEFSNSEDNIFKSYIPNEPLSTYEVAVDDLVDPNQFLDEDETCVEDLSFKNEELKSDEALGIEYGISAREMNSQFVEDEFPALLDASKVEHKDNSAEEKQAEESSEISFPSWSRAKRGRKKKPKREMKDDISVDIIKNDNIYKILNEIPSDEVAQSTHLFLENVIDSNSVQISFDEHTLVDHSHITPTTSYEKLDRLNKIDVAKKTKKSKKNVSISIEDSKPWPKEFSNKPESNFATEICHLTKPSTNLLESKEKVIESITPQLPKTTSNEEKTVSEIKQMRPQKTKSNRSRLCSFNQMSVTRDDVLEDCIDASSSSLPTHLHGYTIDDQDTVLNQQYKNDEVLPDSTDPLRDDFSKKKKKSRKTQNLLAPCSLVEASECRDNVLIAPRKPEGQFDCEDLTQKNFENLTPKNSQDRASWCDKNINDIARIEPSQPAPKIESKSTHICGTLRDQTSITPNKLSEKENSEENFYNVVALRPSMTVMKWKEPFSIVDQVSNSLAQFHVKPSGEVVREFPQDLTEGKVIPSPSNRKADNRNLQGWHKEDSNKSEIWGRPSAWFTIESNYRESGQQRKISNRDSFRNLDEREGSKNWSEFSCSEFMDVPLTDANEENLIHNAGSHSNWNLALEEAAVKKIKEDVADLERASDTSNPNGETLQKILKNLEVQERAVLALEDKLSVLSDFEEYNTLMAELGDIKSNIYTLKSSISLQLDLNQCKVQSQNQRNADLFKCSEIIATVSSWITTVELKLASDEDIYLSNAEEEKESYNILSQELKRHASQLQQCSCVCNTYLRSGDNDVSVKNMFDTLKDLAVKIDQLKYVIEERRQAIQVKPSPTVLECAEMSSKEVQTAGDPLSNKEVQTSLKDTESLFENAGVQTSNVEDLSTDCSEDLSSFNEDRSTSTLSNLEDIEVPIAELTNVQVPLEAIASDDRKTHVQSLDLESISGNKILPSVVETPCTEENIVKEAKFSKQSPKLIRRDTFTVIDNVPSGPSLGSTFDPIVSHDLASSSVTSTFTQPTSPSNSKSSQKPASESTNTYQDDTLVLEESLPPKRNVPSRLTRQGTFTYLESDLNTQDDLSQITTNIDPSREGERNVAPDQDNLQFDPTALDTTTIEEEMAYKQLQPKDQDLQNSPRSAIKSLIEPNYENVSAAVEIEPIITSVKVSTEETGPKSLQAEDITDHGTVSETQECRLNKGVQFGKTTADQESQIPDPEMLKVEKCDKAIGTKNKSHKKKIRRRSDTASFAELIEPLAIEETSVPAIEEGITETESIIPTNIWADACDKINKRIHHDNAFSNLFQEPEVSVDDVTLVTQIIEKMTPNKNLDGSKIVECAEGISVLLENLKKQIFLLQQSTHCMTPEEQIGKLNAVKATKDEIDGRCLLPLLSLSDEIARDLPQGDADNCGVLCQMLRKQSCYIGEMHQLNHDRLANIIDQWKYFMEQILKVDQSVLDLEVDLQKMVDNSDDSLQERLNILEKFDNTREDLTTCLLDAMPIAEEVLISAPQYSIPDAAHTAHQRLKHIQSSINNERVKVLQNMSLIEEYEKTLDDFVQIMDIADELMVLPINVCSLTHLQEDMRSRHRFFIDLNHCKTILESLEGHVNDGTCQKYLEVHSQSIERASDVLERANILSQKMALAVSKWASINEGVADENDRLQVLQNQFLELSTKSSNDCPQRIVRLQSLAVDVYQNMARISQLTDSAHGLRKIITSPELECGFNKYKEQAVQVYNDVNNHLNALQLFEENFTQFEMKKGKVITWICESEFLIKDLESELDLKKLWELQAQFEVYGKMKDASCEHFKVMERTLKLIDADEHKASLETLQEKWQKLACRFQELQNKAFETYNMTIDDLPSFFETVGAAMEDLPATIENEEQFLLHSNNIQAIQKALQQSKEKFNSSKPKTESESAQIKALIHQMRKMKCKIDKEAENALTFEYYIGDINERMCEVNRELSRSDTALAQYESALNLRQNDVIQASNSCEILDDELKTISDAIATLFEMFHHPPRCMTVVVSLPIIERNVTLIKNKYEDLETRCKSLLNLLRVQMELWKDFTDQLRKVDESVEEVSFMTDLMRLHGTVDYQRLATVTDNLHDLSENFKQRGPDLLHGLHGAVDRVKAVCSSDISDEIDRAVGGSVEAWSKANKSLRDLCERYKRALDLWGVYRKNCDLVNLWIDTQAQSLTNLPAEEARHQLQVYELAVHEQREKLDELRGMVIEIASKIGVNENNLLADEIVLLSKKLEDVKSALTMLNNMTVSEKHKVYFEELSQTENYISSVKEDLQTTKNGEIRTVEQVQELRLHLESLTKTDTILNGMRTKQAELLSNLQTPVRHEDLRIVELLESWQEVFRETFQQYHRVFSLIAGDQDSQEAMKLWMDYLTSIEEFLSTKIPDSYDCLSNDEHLCQMHENVLTSQNAILLGEKTDSHSDMSERLKLLTTRHDETLSKIKGRHDQVKQRLDLWQLYRNEQKKLLLWLGRVENEQSQLNLRYRYLHLRTLTTNLNKIEDLLGRIPQGDKLIASLRSQHKNLLSGCGSAVSTSVRMELDAADQRVRNLEAALRTWHDFLAKTRDSFDLDEKLAQHIDDMFSKIQTAIIKEKDVCERVTYAIPALENSLQLMKSFEKEVLSMDDELVKLTHIEASLKETIDTKDAKFIKQRNWLLKRRQEDIKCELVSVIVHLEERLALWEQFCQRRLEFIKWTDELNGRLEGFSTSLSYPEVALRRLELEFCGEVDTKRVDFDWMVETGLRLAGYENDQQPERFTNMSDKVEEIRHLWEKVNQDTKGEVEKVKRIIKEMRTLKLDTRQLLSWMHKMFSDLSKMVSFDKYDNDAILQKLDEHKAIDEEIGLRSGDVTDLINRSDMFLMDCHNCNISLDIKSFMLNFDSLERKWELLRIECGETKNQIYTTWKMIQDMFATCEREELWLTVKEKQLDEVRGKSESDAMSDKHSFILEANIMLASIQEHAPSFKVLEELYLEVLAKNEITEIPEVDGLLKRFTAYRNAVPKWRDEIDEDVRMRREFEAGHASLVLNLTQLNARLTQLQHLNGAKMENKSSKFKELLTEHIALKGRVEQVDSLKLRLLSDETQTDVEGVEKLAYEYTSMYEDLDKRFKMLKKMFQKPSPTGTLSVNEGVQVDTLKFVNDFAAQVETLPKSLLRQDAFLFDLQHMIKETRENIDKLADLVLMTNNYEEIAKVFACCQSSVDLMNHYTKELESQASVSSSDGVLEEARELAKTFQRMTEKVHFKQQHRMDANSEMGRLRCPECSERNWSQLNTDIWRMEKWLDEAEGTLRASSIIPPSNIEELEDVIIREHKEFMIYLESHRDIINSLNVVGEHLLEHSSNREQFVRVRERLNAVNERWRKIEARANIWRISLRRSLIDNPEFSHVITELLEWMDIAEESIRSCEPIDITEDESVVRGKYDKFKKLRREFQKYELRVASLQEANRVCAEEKLKEFEYFDERLHKVWLRLESLIRLTRLYMLKLGTRLGFNTSELYATLNLNDAATTTTPEELPNESAIDPMSQTDAPSSSLSSDDESRSLLRRGRRIVGRVFRATIPIQAFLLVLMGMASLYPNHKDEYSCATANNLAWSLQPLLRYPGGPPPT